MLSVILFACKSVPEKVKEDKKKFIQVAQENSKRIDIADISNLLEQAKQNNTEGKIKYLGVDKMETIYELSDNNKIKLDSIVIFKKSNYAILYDFATIVRSFEIVRQKSSLNEFEKLDDRLYIGKN
jgi:hypothetical protein